VILFVNAVEFIAITIFVVKVDLGFSESAGNNPWATGYVDIYILD